MMSGAVQASMSWAICVRLSPTHWLCSNLVGRSIATPYAERGARMDSPFTRDCWNVGPVAFGLPSGTSPRPPCRRRLVGIRRWSSGRASGQPPPKSRNIHRSAGPPPFFGEESQPQPSRNRALIAVIDQPSKLVSRNGRNRGKFFIAARNGEAEDGAMARRIVVVVYEGIQSLDAVGPMEVFSAANRESGTAAY